MNKNQKYIVVEHKSNLNVVLGSTCPPSQRIKFTCLDVSPNYIVFGATSGGLYVFKRYPHVLLKLIPSRHGAVSLIAISPNEKSIVLSTSRGVIVIITNCFTSSDFQYHVYSEGKASQITVIKWNRNNEEVFYGNNLGKVSVIIVPNLLTKAIFQAPCASLMHLDSSITQIDCYLKLLLVSTLTRTYLCNTEKEHFIQIGKKLRNGRFGACFFLGSETETNTEDGQNISNATENFIIFCNRPGARIWEVQPDATVSCTHQLKHFFKDNQETWICLDNTDPHSNILQFTKQKPESPESLNFSKMFVFLDKFIITFNSEAFYIFDPETLTVINRYNNLSNIIEVKVVKNFIYLCLENMEVFVFGFYHLENLIMKTLFNQQYHACLEICINYYKEILELVDTSDRIYLLTILEDKLCSCFTSETIDNTLKLVFDAIQNFSKKKVAEKTSNGIVIVNNHNFYENGSNDNIQLDVNEQIDEDSKPKYDALDNENTNLKILSQQYKWSRLNEQVKISKYKRLLDNYDCNTIVVLFQKFNQIMAEKNVDVEYWSFNSFLQYFSSLKVAEFFENSMLFDNSLQFILKGFSVINLSCKYSCACSYPLPSANLQNIQFYNVGCTLLLYLRNTDKKLYEQFLFDIPFMWKYVIEHLQNHDDIATLLPLLMQFNDHDLFTVFLNKFKYDTWDNAIKILIKLKQKKCINCEAQFNEEYNVITWAQLSSFILQSIGPQSTINLLKHYADFITSDDLDAKFYQSCIYAAVFNNCYTELNGHVSVPNKTVVNNNNLLISELVSKYLSDKQKAIDHIH